MRDWKFIRRLSCTGLGVLGSLLLGPATSWATTAASTFDADLEGWTKGTGQSGTVVHQASGGNPGGFVKFTDIGSGRTEIVAPSKFYGSWSSLNGSGVLSWDHFVLDDANGEIDNLSATISGPGGSATFTSGVEGSTSGWVTATATISESEWVMDPNGVWSDLLDDVTELRLKIELVGDLTSTDVEGIDNVSLGPPLPMMGGWGVFLLPSMLGALAGVSVVLWRRSAQQQ